MSARRSSKRATFCTPPHNARALVLARERRSKAADAASMRVDHSYCECTAPLEPEFCRCLFAQPARDGLPWRSHVTADGLHAEIVIVEPDLSEEFAVPADAGAIKSFVIIPLAHDCT